jgi:hypothetical protein
MAAITTTWGTWVQQAYTAGAACSYTIADTTSSAGTDTLVMQKFIWQEWTTTANTCINLTTGATATIVWPQWCQHRTAYTAPTRSAYQSREETDEERQARLARLEEQRRQREEANQRAFVLLLSFLNRRQRRQYREFGYFTLLTKDRKRRYRIKKGWGGNVERLDHKGHVIERYCIHPREWVPDEDNMIAQKLMLLTDEERFLKTANRQRVLPPGVQRAA